MNSFDKRVLDKRAVALNYKNWAELVADYDKYGADDNSEEVRAILALARQEMLEKIGEMEKQVKNKVRKMDKQKITFCDTHIQARGNLQALNELRFFCGKARKNE